MAATRVFSRFLRVPLSLVALAIAACVIVPGLRWRGKVALLKAAGSLPDITWGELWRMGRPGGRYDLEPLARNRDPYQSIQNPFQSQADVDAGRREFLRTCSECHGTDGDGITGINLTTTDLRFGSSDWALYRTITRGLRGTPMAAHPYADREAWQLVAYLRALRREGAASAGVDLNAAALSLAPVSALRLIDAEKDSANWLTYSGSYRGWRYSRLRQIDRSNVARLRLLWMHQATSPDQKFETTPLVVDGRMYLTAPGSEVIALDAGSGQVLWRFRPDLPSDLRLCCGSVNRGLAILGHTLYLGTLDARLIALDATNGRPRWERSVAEYQAGYSLTGAPLALGDKVIIGVAGGEYGIRGFIDAYDAETGVRRWRFHTVPAPGEPGADTWSGDSWRTGGGPTWLTGAYDPALNLLYWGVGNPGPDYNGETRGGDNLYTNGVVALDPDSGRLVWHFQFTPHDEYDRDAVQIPLLVDTTFRGEHRRLLLWANRNAFYYVLDRRTGAFLLAREFARQTWAEGIDSTGRPVLRPGAPPRSGGRLVYPATIGATNWWSPSYSPRTGLVYVPTRDEGSRFISSGVEYRVGEEFKGGAGMGLPSEVPVTAVRALEATTGTRRWEHILAGPLGPGRGWSIAGVLSTGGDVVFAGGGSLLVALDARSGAALWEFNAGGRVLAAPITYAVGERQQLTIAAGGSILTFGLPAP
jgi:alcohol dehydrogenase (cytochrome c)